MCLPLHVLLHPPPPSPRRQAPLLEGHVRSEILLGVTVLRPAEGDPTRTEMTTVRTEKKTKMPKTGLMKLPKAENIRKKYIYIYRSLLCDPESKLRLGGREKRTTKKVTNGMTKKKKESERQHAVVQNSSSSSVGEKPFWATVGGSVRFKSTVMA